MRRATDQGRTAQAATPSIAAPAVASTPAAAPAGPLPTAASAGFVIDAASWPAVVESASLTGMVRQYALNCVPARFENEVLILRMDAAVADRRTRAIDEKLIQGLSKYLGREIRVLFETAEAELSSPARQRAQAEQERVAARGHSIRFGSGGQRIAGALWSGCRCGLGQARELARRT